MKSPCNLNYSIFVPCDLLLPLLPFWHLANKGSSLLPYLRSRMVQWTRPRIYIWTDLGLLGKIHWFSMPSTVYICLHFCGLTACGILVPQSEMELTSLVLKTLSHDYCCSVTKLCPALCNSMDWSTPGFPVFHYLPEFAQTHVHWVGDTIQPSHPLLPPFSSRPQSFPASRSFPRSRLFTSGGQSIGASAAASVLPINIQGWFPFGLIGLISLLSKGLPRDFSRIIVQKHQFFGIQPSLCSTSHICTWVLEKL